MIGETVSHYRILSEIGRGGMGEVYLAEDTRLRRKVALKFLSPELVAERSALARFRNEARVIAELSHPNIATIHDVGDAEGRPFLVLEYLEGPTLKELIAAQPLSVDQVVGLGKALASGLAEAHSKGIFHRDIKPANVLITDGGVAKILDFGLARKSDATQITAQGMTLGTIGYMSPEQLRGEPVDARSDIWSVGVVLYESLTGQHPFYAESNEAAGHRISHEQPTTPSALRGGLPVGLESVILRCLEKDRDARLQSAQDLAAAFRAIETASHPAVAVPPAGGTRLRGPRLKTALAIAALLAITAIAVLRLIPGDRDVTTPRLAVTGFEYLAPEPDLVSAAGLVALVQTSLANARQYSVVSPEYLAQIRRQKTDDTTSPIPRDLSLEIAREANATHVLTGEIHPDEAATHRVSWRIIESTNGAILETGVVEATTWSELAALVSRDVSDEMLELVAGDRSGGAPFTAVIGSEDPVAYRHYSAAMLATNLGQFELARFELLRAVEQDTTFALAYFALSRNYNPNSEMELARIAAAGALRHQDRLGRKERMLLRAHQLLLDYAVSKAIIAYDEILGEWPDSREALVSRAQTQFYFRYWNDALESATEGLRLYANEPDLVDIEIGSLVQLGRFRPALLLVQSQSDTRAVTIDAPGSEGDILLRIGEPDRAREAYDRVLRGEPGNIWATKGLTSCLYAEGKLEEAIQSLRQAVEVSESDVGNQKFLTNSWALLGLRSILGDAGRIQELYRVDTMRSDFARSLLSQDLLYAGKPDAAIALIHDHVDDVDRDGRRTRPEINELGVLIRCWAATGNLDRASRGYETLKAHVAADPDLPRGFVQLELQIGAELALAHGDAAEAQRLLGELFREGFVRLSVEEIMVFETEARMYELMELHDRAIVTLEELTRVFGSRTLAHFHLGQLYERVGRREEAREKYLKCLELWSGADADYPYPAEARARLLKL